MHQASHQHQQIPPQEGCPEELSEGRDIQPICLYRSDGEVREKQDEIHGRWQPHKLSRRSGNSYRRHDGCKTPIRQRCVHKGQKKIMAMDISNFYLMTPLKRPEYIRLKLTDIPEDIIVEYGLSNKASKDGSIYIETNKGMYGLP